MKRVHTHLWRNAKPLDGQVLFNCKNCTSILYFNPASGVSTIKPHFKLERKFRPDDIADAILIHLTRSRGKYAISTEQLYKLICGEFAKCAYIPLPKFLRVLDKLCAEQHIVFFGDGHGYHFYHYPERILDHDTTEPSDNGKPTLTTGA